MEIWSKQKNTIGGHHGPANKTPFKWHFAGMPIINAGLVALFHKGKPLYIQYATNPVKIEWKL